MAYKKSSLNDLFKGAFYFCGLAGNRTWIWGFGGPYTIHCTTRPLMLMR